MRPSAALLTTVLLLMPPTLSGCHSLKPGREPQNFREEVAFLEAYTDVVVLGPDERGPRLALLPAWQGRVAVSTARGNEGKVFGWLNRELIRSRKLRPRMNAFGGEDRFWLGPEGGEFGLFFAPGAAFEAEHWQTPAAIDSEPYTIVERGPYHAVFVRDSTVENRAGTLFEIGIRRTVRLFGATEILDALDVHPGAGVGVVAFETENELTNRGTTAWTQATGLLSIWILGMFQASPGTVVVLPYESGPESERGPAVNDSYFGAVPADRLVVGERAIFFRGDARQRGKIGIGARRAVSIMGSYDSARSLLTIVQYDLPQAPDGYVDSSWEISERPFGGDVVNSYNDGPPRDGGRQVGAFYELESSSPALALAPGEAATHRHKSFHFVGTEAQLDPLAKALLGVSIAEIQAALPPPGR